jgi:GNAT superfamily N-acetyltransferase
MWIRKSSWYAIYMEIRLATPVDSLLLSSLNTDVQRLHAEHHPGFFKMPTRDNFAASFFDEMLANPAVSIFIAEEDGQALGYVVCKLMERVENPFTFAMRYLLIDQISVRPRAQGRGVGAALMKQAEVLAGELGIQKIQLDSWDFNRKAHAFFENMGFVKFTHRFWKDL